MNIKIGEMKSEKIVKGIFMTGLIYCVIILLPIIIDNLIILGINSSSKIFRLSGYIYIIKMIVTPIMLAVIIKLSCEVLYKFIKVAEIMINNNSREDN